MTVKSNPEVGQMRIPRKIDDRLKDAIVNIQFTTTSTQEEILECLKKVLVEDYEFIDLKGIHSLPAEIGTVLGVHKNKLFRLDVTQNALTFNLIEGYAGWQKYFDVVKDTLSKVGKTGFITAINRIGLRYISTFENTDIFDNLKVAIDLSAFNPDATRTHLRTEVLRGEFWNVITLLNKIPQDDGSKDYFSVIDIDTIKIFEQPTTDYPYIIEKIDDAHIAQVSTFFSLLKPDFLATLNPQY